MRIAGGGEEDHVFVVNDGVAALARPVRVLVASEWYSLAGAQGKPQVFQGCNTPCSEAAALACLHPASDHRREVVFVVADEAGRAAVVYLT